MSHTEFRFRSLMHMGATDDAGDVIRQLRRSSPPVDEYLHRLFLHMVVSRFYAKLARHKQAREQGSDLIERRPYTLRELADDVERRRSSRDRISGIRLKAADDEETVLTDDDLEIFAA